MALSFPARELIKGIWCEADDQGVFEWKPLTLKAKIMPADAVDTVALLAELTDGEFVTRFEQEGKSYGAVRNFRKYQRPKKPNSTHVLPPEFRIYVGLSDDTPEPGNDKSPSVPSQSPPSGGKPPQMEDEGGRREKEEEVERSESPSRELRSPPGEYAFRGTIIRLTRSDFDRWRASYSTYPDLQAELETIDAKLVDEGFTGKWFGRVSAWLKKGHEERLRKQRAPTSETDPDPTGEIAVLRGLLKEFVATCDDPGGRWGGRGYWPSNRGIPPGQPGCQVPPHLLAEFGLQPPSEDEGAYLSAELAKRMGAAVAGTLPEATQAASAAYPGAKLGS